MASIVNSTPASASHFAFKINYNLQGIESCSIMVEIKQYHARIIKFGLSSDNDSIGRVIKFCASRFGDIEYALKVFDEIPDPDVFIYNMIMKGLMQRHMVRTCIGFYLLMLESLVCPNSFTFPILIKACSDIVGCNEVVLCKQVHCHVVKFGLFLDVYCLNNLIQMYVKLQRLDEARKVFDQMIEPNAVSWTTMISGYSKMGLVDEAYDVFMLMDDKKSNPAACNAMLTAYVQSNRFHESFAIFRKLQTENVPFDKSMATTMLSSCSSLGALELGKWIHKKIIHDSVEMDSKLVASILDMYCKCGCLDKAFEFFTSIPQKVISLSSWNIMIGGMAMHGQGAAAVNLFKEMERKRIIPDSITFVNLLNACSHSGLVKQGQFYFQYMFEFYGIQRKPEHYGCITDLLGRAGMFSKALKLVEEMEQSIGPDASVLGALLGACRIHKNIHLGEQIGKRLIELEPENSGRYVLLANLYANVGRWEDVASVRNLMSINGVKKSPGSSMIELHSVVNEFITGENSHQESSKI